MAALCIQQDCHLPYRLVTCRAGAARNALQTQHKAPPQNVHLDCTLVNLSLPVLLLAGQVLNLPIHREDAHA